MLFTAKSLPLREYARYSNIKNLLNNNKVTQSAPIPVQVSGWVSAKRRSKSVAFVKITDGSTFDGLQCVFTQDENSVDLSDISVGSYISLNGRLVESLGKGQSCELVVNDVEICSPANDYPIQNKRHSLEFLRQKAHLRNRTQLFRSVSVIRNSLSMAAHDYFQSNDFMHIHTPIITSNDCEGAGEVFQVVSAGDCDQDQFFKKPAYLTVSSQLHLEMGLGGFSRVYTLSPCFRADIGSEQSTRHLAEFYMLEAEMTVSNAEKGLDEVVRISRNLCVSLANQVHEKCAEYIEYLDSEFEMNKKTRKRTPNSIDLSLDKRLEILKTPENYQQISYSDAFKLLVESNVKFKTKLREWGQPFQVEHERHICNNVGDGLKPVFVTDYPRICKSFYMKPSKVDERTVSCFDLLVPGIGELAGGSIREDDFQTLNDRIEDLKIEECDWYTDLRRFGTCPHGGFGLGFDRLMMYITGMENIRDVVQVGRWKGTLEY